MNFLSLVLIQELRSIAESNQNVRILEIDLKDFDKYESVVSQVKDVVHDQGLNVLFNSAGISPRSSFLGLKALKANELMDVYSVNVVAPLMLSKSFWPLLKKASEANKSAPIGPTRGMIVNMSSILGSVEANKEGSLYHYRVTKSGLNAATKSLSIDLKNDGIMTLSIHPGWVKTDMGGPKAPMEIHDSCDKMVNTILNIDSKLNGGFIQWDGKKLPW